MAISNKFIDELNDLLMLDHDAVDAYEQAIRALESDVCRTRLREFQEDHRRHIRDLSDCITRYGGTPKNRRDVKGFFIKGMTAIQSKLGDEMALKAMQTNEKLTNAQYGKALDNVAFPADARTIVEKNFADEKRHLAWIVDALATRKWEERPGASV